MNLKPQDIVILLKLIAWEKGDWSYAMFAKELFISVSEVHSGLKRATSSRFFYPENKSVLKMCLMNTIIHGVKYAYPPHRGIPDSICRPTIN